MVDFKASLAQGLKAAAEAEASRKEIRHVFEELNVVLAEETEGNVLIELAEEVQRPNPLTSGLMSISQMMVNSKTVPVIRCRNPQVIGRSERLCEYSMGRAGYPFQLKIDREEWVCHDRVSLEKALADLLRDPVVGEKITRVMAD